MKILIVDDDELILNLIREELEDEFPSFDIDAQNKSDSAYDLFIEKGHDLILTDLKMPGMTGGDLVKKVEKSNKTLPAICVMSGSVNRDLEKVRYQHELFILTKPFEIEDIFGLVQKYKNTLDRI